MLSRSVALRSLRNGVSLRAYATTPSLLAASKKAPAATSFADLHELSPSARAASSSAPASAPAAKKAAATPTTPSGNSTAPEDISSRPAAPGPSGPVVDPQVAAPDTVNRSHNGNGNGSGSGSGSDEAAAHNNWTTSFAGMSERPFDGKAAEVLTEELNPDDVEIKPDGILYLPEIKYRRILNRAFGPGGWAMAPRGETNVGPKVVSREWVLVCLGRYVATARGEQEYFDPNGVATASEGAKSNALMRCCKDLGIASELWDPRFIREFKKKHCVDVFVEDARTNRKRKLWRRRDAPPFEYPLKESK